MTVKMKNCKACGKEVAPSAKVCPSCGQKLKIGMGKKLLIGFGVLIVLGIIGSNSGGEKTSIPTTATPATASIPETKPVAVEPTTEGTSSNVNIKVLEVTTPEFTGRDTVKQYPQGSWIIVKLSIQNNQKDAISVTSASFKLLDKEKREFSSSTEGTVGLEMTDKKTYHFLQ